MLSHRPALGQSAAFAPPQALRAVMVANTTLAMSTVRDDGVVNYAAGETPPSALAAFQHAVGRGRWLAARGPDGHCSCIPGFPALGVSEWTTAVPSSPDRPLCCATPQKKEEDDKKSGRLKQSAGELRVQKGACPAAAPILPVCLCLSESSVWPTHAPQNPPRERRRGQQCAWRRATHHLEIYQSCCDRLAYHAPARSSAATQLAAAGSA